MKGNLTGWGSQRTSPGQPAQARPWERQGTSVCPPHATSTGAGQADAAREVVLQPRESCGLTSCAALAEAAVTATRETLITQQTLRRAPHGKKILWGDPPRRRLGRCGAARHHIPTENITIKTLSNHKQHRTEGNTKIDIVSKKPASQRSQRHCKAASL